VSVRPAISVTHAMLAAKRALEDVRLRVIGEVSEISDKPGYKAVYFSIRDQDSTMPCLMWRESYLASGAELRCGMLVVLDGGFSAYLPKGRLQFVVREVSQAGEGELRIRIAALARKLELEGLMESAKKRSLPKYPTKIALVTSTQGKAIHDVLRTLRRRYPIAELLVAGVSVEGADAPRSIITGLQVALAAKPDVILIVRGGGSYEDLLPFSDEMVSRAIAASEVPVITGIGHEPDNTIADMVSDFRASTPTAAAEAAAPSIEELSRYSEKLGRMLGRALKHRVQRSQHCVEVLLRSLVFRDPCNLLYKHHQLADDYREALQNALLKNIGAKTCKAQSVAAELRRVGPIISAGLETRAAAMASRLHDLSPLAILSRGYLVCTSVTDGKLIRLAAEIEAHMQVDLRFADGKVRCTAGEIERCS